MLSFNKYWINYWIWKYSYWKMLIIWAVNVNKCPVGRQISVEEGTGTLGLHQVWVHVLIWPVVWCLRLCFLVWEGRERKPILHCSWEIWKYNNVCKASDVQSSLMVVRIHNNEDKLVSHTKACLSVFSISAAIGPILSQFGLTSHQLNYKVGIYFRRKITGHRYLTPLLYDR